MTELIAPRCRVIIDNDFSGDPDDLFQTAHHLLSPSVEIPLIIGSHLSVGDPWDPTPTQATNAVARLNELLAVMGLLGQVPVYTGSEVAIVDDKSPRVTQAAEAIVREALREDTELPLYFAAGAGLTELASAWLMNPAIGKRITLLWIGGPEYADLAFRPPGSKGPEYNLRIDIDAARVIFNDSDIRIWQVPRNVYRQMLYSRMELMADVQPLGPLGEFLTASIERVLHWSAKWGRGVGEAYALGDSPLVTLTALQSMFEADPSSSDYVVRKAPKFTAEGEYIERHDGRDIRVYTRIDTRLTFGDMLAKLKLFAQGTARFAHMPGTPR